MKISCNFLRERRTKKPTNEETRKIQNRCTTPSEIEISDLIQLIEQGGTFRACAVSGSEDAGFISSQLLVYDFDNDRPDPNDHRKHIPLPVSEQLTLEGAVQLAKGAEFPPCFAYRTHSAKRLHDKHRQVFVLDRPVTDPDQWKHCYTKVAAVFQKDGRSYTDPVCANPSHLYYGTNRKADYIDLEAVLSVDALLADYQPQEHEKAHKKAQERPQGHKITAHAGNIAEDIVQAVIKQDPEPIRRRTGRTEQLVFQTRGELYDYLHKEIDLADLFNVTEGKAFSCILPEHEDKHPSASVFRTASGVWLYKCQSGEHCPTGGKALTLKRLFELLGGFKSEYRCLEFLQTAFNVTVAESEYSKEQRENIDLIIDTLTNTTEQGFASLCPTAEKNIRNCKLMFIQALNIAKKAIRPDKPRTEGELLFYMSIRQLAKACDKRSLDKLSKHLKILLYHGLLEIVPLEEVPEYFRNKAIQGQQNGHNTVSFYRVPSWVTAKLIEIERQGQRWKAYNYRMNGISYEGFLRTEGLETARRLYPQTAMLHDQNGNLVQRKPTYGAERRHAQVEAILLKHLEAKGYSTEREILHELETVTGTKLADAQIKRSITDLLNTYGLTKRRANKELKNLYGIEGNGYPNIIYREG